MKIIFVHDHKFRKVENKFYSAGGLNNNVLTRYTNFADNVTVIARIIEEKNINEKWSEITNTQISIIGSSNFRFNGIYDEIEKNDKLIVRLPSFLGIQALNINRKFKKPYLIEMVGCPWDGLWNHCIKGKFVAFPMMIITKMLVKRAKYVLYVTNEFLQKRYPTNGKSIGCSDVLLKMHDNTVLEKRLEKIKNNNGKIILGTAAALNVKYKGQRFVIQALAKLKKQGITNFEYQVIGGGDSSDLVRIAEKYGVSNQFKVIGQLNHDKVFEWLESIDIYIQPSLQEGLPRAMVEAMSCGLPCMGTAIAGIPELIDKSMLFGRKSVKEIAELLKSIDKEKMLNLAEQNFTKSKEFDKDILDKKRSDFYTEFIENAKNGE